MVWPHGLSPSRIDRASAALRHVHDAAALLPSSPVEAAYLAGYGPECARKAALTFATETEAQELDKAVAHGVGDDAETALALVCALDPLAVRYQLRDWKAREPDLKHWKEHFRYARSNAIAGTQARRWIEVSTRLVEDVVAALWADGRLPPLEDLVRVSP